MSGRRILFAGTPDFALASLRALCDSGVTPIAVYTRPDRPAGRGRKIRPSPVKEYAQSQSIEVRQPESLKDNEVVSEIGTCLRMIECSEDTEKVLPLDLKQTAFAAWERARQDIYDAWTYETDPANLQPKVSRLNRTIAEHLRAYPPSDMDQARVEKCLDAIEAPCSRREENLLRTVFEAEYPNYDAKSKGDQATVASVPRAFRIAEVSESLSIPRSSLYALIKAGELSAIRFSGRGMIVLEDELNRFLMKRRTNGSG